MRLDVRFALGFVVVRCSGTPPEAAQKRKERNQEQENEKGPQEAPEEKGLKKAKHNKSTTNAKQHLASITQNINGITTKQVEIEMWLDQQIKEKNPIDIAFFIEAQLKNNDLDIQNYTLVRNQAKTPHHNKCSEVIALIYNYTKHCIEEAEEIKPKHTNITWIKYFNNTTGTWTYSAGIYVPTERTSTQEYTEELYNVLHQNLTQIEHLNATYFLTGDFNCPFQYPHEELKVKN